jgi:hypothetical protein
MQPPASWSRSRAPRGRPDGIFVAPFEQGEIGPDLFWAAPTASLHYSKMSDDGYGSWLWENSKTRKAMRTIFSRFISKMSKRTV